MQTENQEVPGLLALSNLATILSNLPFPWAKAVPLINEIETALRANASIDHNLSPKLVPFKTEENAKEEAAAE